VFPLWSILEMESPSSLLVSTYIFLVARLMSRITLVAWITSLVGSSGSGIPTGVYYGSNDFGNARIRLRVKSSNVVDFAFKFKLSSFDNEFYCDDVPYSIANGNVSLTISSNPCMEDVRKVYLSMFDMGDSITAPYNSADQSIHVVTGVHDCVDVVVKHVGPLGKPYFVRGKDVSSDRPFYPEPVKAAGDKPGIPAVAAPAEKCGEACDGRASPVLPVVPQPASPAVPLVAQVNTTAAPVNTTTTTTKGAEAMVTAVMAFVVISVM
jgi:hypothetical protein